MIKTKKILAVASSGGHWTELLRLRPAFHQHKVIYVTTLAAYRNQIGDCGFYAVLDANQWQKFRLLILMLQTFFIVVKVRPDVVISSGAAPGYFAVMFGKLIGAQTIWVDSIANAEEMSLSGRLARKFSDLWLTQWPSLAGPHGPHYIGKVL